MSLTAEGLRLKGFIETPSGFRRVAPKEEAVQINEPEHSQKASNLSVGLDSSRFDGSERQLHDQIESHCKSKGWLYCHSRMDRPSTIAVGWPDFVIFQPNAITTFIECKAKGKKATIGQLSTLAHAKKLGYVAEVVDSFEQFLKVIE